MVVNMHPDMTASALQRAQAELIAERSRFAVFLHNEIGGCLIALKLYLTSAKEKAKNDSSHELVETLTKCLDIVTAAYTAQRNFLDTTNQGILDFVDLSMAVQSYVDKLYGGLPDFQIHVAETEPPEITRDQIVCAFYVIQEALLNSLKHAHANNAWILIHRNRITIEDDGVGWPNPMNEHVGFVLMRSHASRCGAIFSCDKGQFGGARINLEFIPH